MKRNKKVPSLEGPYKEDLFHDWLVQVQVQCTAVRSRFSSRLGNLESLELVTMVQELKVTSSPNPPFYSIPTLSVTFGPPLYSISLVSLLVHIIPMLGLKAS